MKPIREFAPLFAAHEDSTDLTDMPGAGGSAAATNARYFRRLVRYVWQEKRLVVLSVLFGVLGLCLPFVYPMLIGSAIDTVVLGRPHNGTVPTPQQRNTGC